MLPKLRIISVSLSGVFYVRSTWAELE